MAASVSKSASFFAKQDLTIEILSFLDPRSMARAFGTCKDFHDVNDAVFTVFLRTSVGFVSFNESEKLSALSLKNPQDWGSLCKQMGARFSVAMNLDSGKRSTSEQQFKSFLFSGCLGQLRGLSIRDRHVLELPGHLGVRTQSVVGNPTLFALASSAPHLQHLDLTSSTVTNEGISHLHNLKLETLALQCCNRITDRVAEALAGMTSLTELNLSCCKRVTELGLRMLLQTLKNLRKINISQPCILDQRKIGDQKMCQTLADHGQQLTHIEIDHLACKVETIQAMVRNCKSLVFLSLLHVPLVRRSDARELQKINPNLTVRISTPSLDGSHHGVIFANNRVRVKPNPTSIIMRPPGPPLRELTLDEYEKILLASDPPAKFAHVGGDWSLYKSGGPLCRQLKFKSTSQKSLIARFDLLGYCDGGVSLLMEFNRKILKSHLERLGISNVKEQDLRTQSNDELKRVVFVLGLTNEIPKAYLSQINEIIWNPLQEDPTKKPFRRDDRKQ